MRQENTIESYGMDVNPDYDDPTEPKVIQIGSSNSNPDVNLNELYDGQALQIRYEHGEDTDDIVPELSDNVKIEVK